MPVLFWAGQEGDFNVMVTELLGPSLDDLHQYCQSKFSLKTCLLLGKEMLTRLEYFHSKQFLHRDVKPENFCMGIGTKSHSVHIIDYGLSKRYIDPRSGEHIPYREGKNMTGTARYASLNTQKGLEQSRRDDIESLIYVLIYLATGNLPWILESVPELKEVLPTLTKMQKYDIIL